MKRSRSSSASYRQLMSATTASVAGAPSNSRLESATSAGKVLPSSRVPVVS